MMNYATETPVTVLMGLILLIGYIIYTRATLRSIGGFGMFLILSVVAALVWVLYDWGILTLENRAVNTWLGVLALSFVLGIGLSWSLVRRQLSGQADMDDVDE
jgi:ABC-type nickel/cobalt efflux system permease component RcnA